MGKILVLLLKAALYAAGVIILVMWAIMLGGTVDILRETSLTENAHQAWCETQGIVTYFATEEDIVSSSTIVFTYRVGEVDYRGFQGWLSVGPRYSTGDRVTVYYNLSKPSEAVVEQSKSKIPKAGVIMGLVFGAIVFIIYILVVFSLTAWYAKDYQFGRGQRVRLSRIDANLRIACVPIGLIMAFLLDLGFNGTASRVVFWSMVGIDASSLLVLFILNTVRHKSQNMTSSHLR